MATELYMANYAKQFQAEPPDLVSAADCQASLRGIRDKVITTADFNPGDVIYAARPPKGWRWHGYNRIYHGNLGTGVTLSAGTSITGTGEAADPVKFAPATDESVAGIKLCNEALNIGYEFDGETDVVLTIGGANCAVGVYIIAEFEFYAAKFIAAMGRTFMVAIEERVFSVPGESQIYML